MSLKFDANSVPFVEFGDYCIRLETEELPPEYKGKAVAELRETPENIENGLNELRNLLKGTIVDKFAANFMLAFVPR
jgi:hypothetical protein